MPDHSPSTDERASLAQPSQSSSPLECTSHLGFSLEIPRSQCASAHRRGWAFSMHEVVRYCSVAVRLHRWQIHGRHILHNRTARSFKHPLVFLSFTAVDL